MAGGTIGTEFDSSRLLATFVNISVPGVYVDVGAGDPTGMYNNSTIFRASGWKIISIEPNPRMCNDFRNLGYEVCQYAAYARDLGKTTFEVHNSHGGMGGSCLNSADFKDSPANIQKLIDCGYITLIETEALTLNTILARHYPEVNHINILDVDVEYYELQVLAGLDFKKYSPDVMIIENLGNTTKYHDYYKQIGYKLVATAGINDILMSDE